MLSRRISEQSTDTDLQENCPPTDDVTLQALLNDPLRRVYIQSSQDIIQDQNRGLRINSSGERHPRLLSPAYTTLNRTGCYCGWSRSEPKIHEQRRPHCPRKIEPWVRPGRDVMQFTGQRRQKGSLSATGGSKDRIGLALLEDHLVRDPEVER